MRLGVFDTRNTYIRTGSGEIRRKILFSSVYLAIFGAEIRALERRNSDCGAISIAHISGNKAVIGINGSEMRKI